MHAVAVSETEGETRLLFWKEEELFLYCRRLVRATRLVRRWQIFKSISHISADDVRTEGRRPEADFENLTH